MGTPPPSTSASPPATTSRPWTWPSRRPTCGTNFRWSAGMSRCSRMTPSPASPGGQRPAPSTQQRRHGRPIAAAAGGKDLVDGACAKKAAAEQTRDWLCTRTNALPVAGWRSSSRPPPWPTTCGCDTGSQRRAHSRPPPPRHRRGRRPHRCRWPSTHDHHRGPPTNTKQCCRSMCRQRGRQHLAGLSRFGARS